ncbi:BrnT family toxin [Duganella sp. 1224]|uniref:BrnT family toxin n=1 Tax=Duganella sp. 1224 TaxID=2587052 RepID=UPI0015C87B92
MLMQGRQDGVDGAVFFSLSAAFSFDWDDAVIWPALRYHYAEPRECALGFVGNHLYFLVFVDESCSRRIISMRPASKGEVKKYVPQKT